jgi:hypothetical protein
MRVKKTDGNTFSTSASNTTTTTIVAAVRARYPNGDPELGTGYAMDGLPWFQRKHDPENTTQNYNAYPKDWPGVYWLDEPEGGEMPYGGPNAGGTGRWDDFYGGICSGRCGLFFRQRFTLEDAIVSHACPLEASLKRSGV